MRALHLGSCALSGAFVVTLAGCGVSGLIAPGAAGSGATTEISDSLPHGKTFYYTGRRQLFNVPPGVNRLTVIALGAYGAAESPSAVGRGGRVYAILAVTPGERLFIYVGGIGNGSIGGFNGGADGGAGGDYCDCRGYGGGGASDIREGGDRLSDRILVVAGGGGQGASFHNSIGGNGGQGGDSTGGPGANGSSQGSGRGGGGGRQHKGGAGGSGGSGSYGSPGGYGMAGSFVRGGVGGAGDSQSGYGAGAGGGGGGGGYYGGGGGGAGWSYYYGGYAGGGGGGGSSYIESSAIAYRSWRGWKSKTGYGLVVLHWK